MNAAVHPYATLAYANTLAHVGRPQFVASWQSYVLLRQFRGHTEDAIGPYPLTCIAPGSDIGSGLASLREVGAVSVTIVVDGLLGPASSDLHEAFPIARPFKTHYVFDPNVAAYVPSKHHSYEIRRANQRSVEVKVVELEGILDAWVSLYDELVSHRAIKGTQCFSRDSFAALARCHGLCTVAAYIGQELVSCHLWFRYGGHVWSHLAATSALGYETGAAYAVYDYSIRTFSGNVINLGGTAGNDDAPDNGLVRFKAGFANRKQQAFLCGVVLDAEAYRSLCDERGPATDNYFPAYRSPQLSDVSI